MCLRPLILRIPASNPHFYGWVIPKLSPLLQQNWELGKAAAVQFIPLSLILSLCPSFFASEGHCWFMLLLWSTVIPSVCLAFSRLFSRLSLCNLFILLFLSCSCLCEKPISKGTKKVLFVYTCVCIYKYIYICICKISSWCFLWLPHKQHRVMTYQSLCHRKIKVTRSVISPDKDGGWIW